MVPTHFVRLLALPEEVRARYDVSSMQLVGHTGAACPIDVKRQMIEWWGPVFHRRLRRHRGRHDVHDHQRGVAGAPRLGRPRDPAVHRHRRRRRRERGARRHRGPAVLRGRHRAGHRLPDDPEKTASAHLRPGVFTLGEIGYVDDDGYVFITDRFSDMIVSGGVNIYPAEAEQVLIEHPRRGRRGRDRRAAPRRWARRSRRSSCRPTRPLRPTAGRAHRCCRERLAGYKCPRSVDIVDSYRPHHDGQGQQAGAPAAVLGVG